MSNRLGALLPLQRPALLLLPGALVIYLSREMGGGAAGWSATGAVAFAVMVSVIGLGAQGSVERRALSGLANAAGTVLPAALTVYLAFNAGGFFPDTTGIVAVVLAVALMARIALAGRPFGAVGVWTAVAGAALAGFAAWTGISAAWSDSPERALIELNRVLLYLFALLLFASLAGRIPASWMLRALAGALAIVCAAALSTRLLPDILQVERVFGDERLSYPLTYSNALGVMAALGMVFCLHLASSGREPPAARILGSAGLPVAAVCLLFTFSRGATAAAVVGVIAYVGLARPRALLSGLLAAVPTGVALKVAYDADLVSTTRTALTGPGESQAAEVATTLGLCVVAAALVRALLLVIDRPLERIHLPSRLRLPVFASLGAVSVATAIAVFVSFGVADRIGEQYERFAEGSETQSTDVRKRLTNVGNSQRLGYWKVALNGFEEAEVRGRGAGTHQLSWARERDTTEVVRDGHSLYFEVLGELGIVGGLLIVVALGSLVMGLVVRSRGGDRHLIGAMVAAFTVCAIHAGVDWDWEMPATTVWLFCLVPAALPRRDSDDSGHRDTSFIKRVIAVAALLVLAVPTALLPPSERRLNGGVNAMAEGDCRTAVAEAESANSPLELRVQPYQIIGYCEAARGRHDAAVNAMERAVEHDPRNWESHYGLAVVQAAAGADPRSAAQLALALNPRDELTQDAVSQLAASSPSERTVSAQEALLALGPDGPPLLLSDL